MKKMLGDLVAGNNSLCTEVLLRLDLGILCADNMRRLPGKADGSLHMCPPGGSKLAPLTFISLTKKNDYFENTHKKLFLKKCLLLGRGNKMMDCTMDRFFFSFCKITREKTTGTRNKILKNYILMLNNLPLTRFLSPAQKDSSPSLLTDLYHLLLWRIQKRSQS